MSALYRNFPAKFGAMKDIAIFSSHCLRLNMELRKPGEVITHLPPSQPKHIIAQSVRIASLIDHCGGVGAFTMLDDSRFVGTVDLRVDYLKPTTVNEEIIAESSVVSCSDKFICTDVKCWNANRSSEVAIGRLLFGVYPTPVATKTFTTDYADLELSAEAFAGIVMDIATTEKNAGHIVTRLPYHDILLGNRFLRVLHGGVVAGYLEQSGKLCVESLLRAEITKQAPNSNVVSVSVVDLDVTYLKGAPLGSDLICEAIVSSRTSRLVRVDLACWDFTRTTKIAAGGALFIVS